MTPIIFINSKNTPFVDQILSGRKRYETRTRNTLRQFIGHRVLLAETGNGRPVVRCTAVITEVIEVISQWEWIHTYRKHTGIRSGSRYDWQPDTKVKYLYRLAGVVACHPFTPPEDIRHGRVWMEYNA